jgi:tetratricopeptide (TPR) repeat protein
VRAAEAAWRIAPQDLNVSRNLSLACKQLGAVLHRLQSRTEARTLFDQALALDRARVERDPAKGLWRLDVSFSLGSIGALLQGDGDLDGAFAHYQQAVDLRRAVVASEPKDEFARLSLARGYHRLAGIDAERGRVAESLEWHDRRVQLYRAHLDAHPERDSAWRDYAQAAVGSLTASLDMLEAKPPGARRAHLAQISAMLQTLVATRARWVKEGRAGEFVPTDEGLQLVAQRLKRLQP